MVQKILAKLEAVACRLQLKYMANRRTTEVIGPGRILFHPHDCRDWVLSKYKEKLKSLDNIFFGC